MDDVLLNKAAIMERCLRRVAEEYAGTPSRLLDPTHQDAIVLNLERACQAAIDAAMYLVARDHRLPRLLHGSRTANPGLTRRPARVNFSLR
jgi:uncharacterized protein YutE (UPF0331/DUF86 family)